MPKYNRNSIRMAILLPLGAFVLRVIRLDYKPLWWDEGRNVFFANLDWQSAANVAVRSGDVNPPVYRMLLSAWMSTVSPSPLTIRLLSVFFGVLTVAVIYRFAVEIFNRRVGTITGVLSACAPAFIYYSQEAKGYTLMVLAVVWSSWVWYRLHSSTLNKQQSLWWSASIATFMGAGSHYFYFLFVFTQIVWTAAWCWLPDGNKRTTPNTKHLVKWIAVQTLGVTPILIYSWHSIIALMAGFKGSLSGGLPFHIPSLDDLARWGATTMLESSNPYRHVSLFLGEFFHENIIGPNSMSNLRLVIGSTVLVAIYMGLRRYSSKVFPKKNLVMWVFIPSILSLIFSFMFSYYYARFLIFVLPAIFLLIASGLQSLWKSGRVLFFATGLALLVVWTGYLSSYYTDPGDIDEDWRGLVDYLAQAHRPGDLVVHTYDWMQGYIHVYTESNDDFDYFYVAGLNTKSLASMSVARERLWLLDYENTPFSYGNWPGAWMREHYALAGTHTFGNSSISAFVHPDNLGNVDRSVRFTNGIEMNWVPVEYKRNSGDAVAVELVFGAPTKRLDAYQIFLHLLDSEGKLIAGNDIGPYNNLRPTVTWSAGEIVHSPHALLLPFDIVAGEYELHAGMYSIETGMRLLTENGKESVRLGLVEIPQKKF